MKREVRRRQRKRQRWFLGLAVIGILVLGFGSVLGQSRQARTHFPTVKKSQENQQLTKEESQINQWLQESHFVGTAFIVQHKKVLLSKGYGYAVKRTGQLNNALSYYNIGSVQKGLTAVLLMHLLSQQGLTLATPLSTFYPQVPGANQITLKSMTTMTSGLSLKTAPENLTNEADVLAYNAQHVRFQPQKLGVFNYQPVNFVLLAGIIRQLTGESYQQAFMHYFVQQKQLDGVHYLPPTSKATHLFTESYLGRKVGFALDYQQPHREIQSHLLRELGTGNVYFTALGLYHYFDSLTQYHYLTPKEMKALYASSGNQTYLAGIYQTPQEWHVHGVEEGYQTWGYFTPDNQTSVLLLSNAGQSSDGPLAHKIFQLLQPSSI